MKNFKFAVSFRGISRLGAAFIFLRWSKIAHIAIRVTRLQHTGEGFESIRKFAIGNRFHVTLRIVSPTICKQRLQVKRWKVKAKPEKAKNSILS